MTPDPDREDNLPERKESLWRLIVSPTAWAMHFLLSYVTVAVWCEKFARAGGSLEPARWAVAAYTLLALAVIGHNGFDAWRRHRLKAEPLPHDFDTPGDRHRFLGFATLLLAGLSAVAVLFAVIAVFHFHDCR
jgi:hypothetical protein